jgi:hypothetical protein
LKPTRLPIARGFPLNIHNLHVFCQIASSYRPQATQTEGFAAKASPGKNLKEYRYLDKMDGEKPPAGSAQDSRDTTRAPRSERTSMAAARPVPA